MHCLVELRGGMGHLDEGCLDVISFSQAFVLNLQVLLHLKQGACNMNLNHFRRSELTGDAE